MNSVEMSTPLGLASRHSRRSWASIVQSGHSSVPRGDAAVERVGGGFSSPSLVSPPSELPAAVKAQQRVRQRRLTLAKGGPPPLLVAHLAEHALAGAKRTRDCSSEAKPPQAAPPTPRGRRASGHASLELGEDGAALALSSQPPAALSHAGQASSLQQAGLVKPAKVKERRRRRDRRSDAAVAPSGDENEPSMAFPAGSQKKARVAAPPQPTSGVAAAIASPPPQVAAPVAPSPPPPVAAPALPSPPREAEAPPEAPPVPVAGADDSHAIASPAPGALRRSPRLWPEAETAGGAQEATAAPAGSPAAMAHMSPASRASVPPASARSTRSGGPAAAATAAEEEVTAAVPALPSSVGALVRDWGLRVAVAGAEAVGEGVGRHTEYVLRTSCAPELAAAAAAAAVVPPPVRRRYRAFATLRDEITSCSGAGAALRRAMRGRAFPPKAVFPWRSAVIAERTAGLGAFSQAALELAAGGSLRRCCAKSVVIFLGLVRPQRQGGRGRE